MKITSNNNDLHIYNKRSCLGQKIENRPAIIWGIYGGLFSDIWSESVPVLLHMAHNCIQSVCYTHFYMSLLNMKFQQSKAHAP